MNAGSRTCSTTMRCTRARTRRGHRRRTDTACTRHRNPTPKILRCRCGTTAPRKRTGPRRIQTSDHRASRHRRMRRTLARTLDDSRFSRRARSRLGTSHQPSWRRCLGWACLRTPRPRARRRIVRPSALDSCVTAARLHRRDIASDDSGAPDASVDAREARSVSDHAAPDADVPEADLADASDSDWPGWRRIPDLQVFNCPLDVAIDPAAVVPAIKWNPCTDGRPNCEEIDGTPFSPEVIKFPNGWFSRDGRAFMLAHFIRSNIISQYSIYDAKTLTPLAAWKGKHGPSPFCDAHTEFTETKMGVLYATIAGWRSNISAVRCQHADRTHDQTSASCALAEWRYIVCVCGF